VGVCHATAGSLFIFAMTSSILRSMVMRTLKRRSLFSKECENYGAGADYSLNLRLSTVNYNFVDCSVSMSEHFHPVSIALKPDYFPEPGDLKQWVMT